MRHPRRIGRQITAVCREIGEGAPVSTHQAGHGLPGARRRRLGDPAPPPPLLAPGRVGNDAQAGEGSLEQANQPWVRRDGDIGALRRQIRQDAGEQDLVAHALLGCHQQRPVRRGP